MDLPRGDLLRYGIAAVIVLALIIVGRRVYAWLAGREERDLEAQVKAAIDAGDLRLAGDIQLRRGLLVEASRIYVRAKEHARAAAVLARLGKDAEAADEYEKAADWAKAAPLFKKTGSTLKAAECYAKLEGRAERLLAAECYTAVKEHLKAGRIYQDLEEFERASECFAKFEDLDSLDVALTMLENAALAKTTERDKRVEIWRRAAELAVKLGAHDRAARAFDEAGDTKRAATIYEQALKKMDVAAVLYAEAGATSDSERLVQALGGPSAIREARMARARAKGEGALTEDMEAVAGGSTVRANSDDNATVVPADRGGRAGKPGAPRLEDRFELLGELGRGGMGIVHRAKDLRLGRFVALKFLPEDVESGSTLHRLFHREARAAAALTHPGIVTVYDVGELGGREFIAMELVEGKTLDRILDDEGPVPVGEALEIMEGVLVAMEYAHQKSVIHRDLKPANLMRTKTGVKVMDFGLAKVVSARSSSGKTVIGGTPNYMPPEQRTGDADHRSDVFALGATFYELMSGVLPGNPGEPANVASSYPTLRQRVPSVPARLSDLVMRCLEHDRHQRPQDIGSVLRELREIRAELAAEPKAPPKAEPKAPPKAEPKPAPKAEPKPEPKVEAKPRVEEPKKRAPLPRIAREEEDAEPVQARVERVAAKPSPAAPAPSAKSPAQSPAAKPNPRKPIPRED